MDYLTQLLRALPPPPRQNQLTLENLRAGWYAMGAVLELCPPKVQLLTLVFTDHHPHLVKEPVEVVVEDNWVQVEDSQLPLYQQLQAEHAYVMCLLDEFEQSKAQLVEPFVLSGEQIRSGLPGWHLKPTWVTTSLTESAVLFQVVPLR